MAALPTGTVTFLFTDIEGSTKLWEQFPDAMRDALTRHDALLNEILARHNGYIFKTMGDAFCAAFDSAVDALGAAVAAQRALYQQEWGETGPLRVRVALHTGSAEERSGDYVGPTINRVTRLLGAGHGGQTLLSLATQELVRDSLPPGVELRDLGEYRLKDLVRLEHIFQLVPRDLPTDFPRLRSMDAYPNNLPRQLSSFIGREREMEEVKRLLMRRFGNRPMARGSGTGRLNVAGETRLLTLTGSGGIGKTRLAVQVAADLLEEYPDGVWLVELAALNDPALVPQAVASVLGVREEPGRRLTDTLAQQLISKNMLLLLDNCEHLVTACAALVNALMRSCLMLQIVATSREALGIAGETAWRVPSLAVPDLNRLPALDALTEGEAMHLFLERATTALPSFTLTEQNAPAIAQICRRLDGIPLAIELAAARVRVLSPEQIADRLDDRFRLLTGGSRTALPRQQTLRATMDWSYELLQELEKALLRRLAVFPGGFTLEAVETICTGEAVASADRNGCLVEEYEALTLLLQLVDKSLVMMEEQDGEARYRLLETVRQYSQDKLMESGEVGIVRDRHRDWYLALAEQAGPELQGAGQEAWLTRLEMEHDNLRAALKWSRAQTGHLAHELRLCAALWQFWSKRGHLVEGRELLADVLERSADCPENLRPYRAAALYGAGILAWGQGDYSTADALLNDSLSLFRELDDTRGIASALGGLGWVAQRQGHQENAAGLYAEAQELFRQIGDSWGVAWALTSRAWEARDRGEFEAATCLEEEALGLWRELKDEGGIAHSLNSLGEIARFQGDFERARKLLEESLELRRELGDKRGIAASLGSLGILACKRGDYETAHALYEENLLLCRELGDRSSIAYCLEGMAMLAVAQGDDERAAQLLGAAATLRETIRSPLPPSERADHDRTISTASDKLGSEAFREAWTHGRTLSLEQALQYALA